MYLKIELKGFFDENVSWEGEVKGDFKVVLRYVENGEMGRRIRS